MLTCEVHGDGVNEHRYISICYNICPGVRAMQKYMAVSVSLGGDSKTFTRGPQGSMSIGAAGTAGAKTDIHPGQRLAWPCGVRLGGGMSGGYPHAGALRWAVWCGTCHKTPKIGRDRGGVPVQGALVRAQSFTKRQVGSFWGLCRRGRGQAKQYSSTHGGRASGLHGSVGGHAGGGGVWGGGGLRLI